LGGTHALRGVPQEQKLGKGENYQVASNKLTCWLATLRQCRSLKCHFKLMSLNRNKRGRYFLNYFQNPTYFQNK
jgi:hypothetical protein